MYHFIVDDNKTNLPFPTVYCCNKSVMLIWTIPRFSIIKLSQCVTLPLPGPPVNENVRSKSWTLFLKLSPYLNFMITEYKNYWNFRCVKFHMAVCVRKHSSIISVCIVDIVCFPILSIFGTVFKMLVIGNSVCNEKLYKININIRILLFFGDTNRLYYYHRYYPVTKMNDW